MAFQANGTFEVNLIPQKPDEQVGDSGIARLLIDKQFRGALDGTSRGQMLSMGTDIEGSAVYVAMERFSGTLDGRNGTFALHHTGIMTRGTPQLTISVVPDSGTGELIGIAGQMTINIDDGRHSFSFEYTFSDAH